MNNKKEFFNFVVIGFLTVLIDSSVYTLILKMASNFSFAKTFGFVSGTFFSFFANRNFTFKIQNSIWIQIYKFALLYSGSLMINVIINNMALNYFSGTNYRIKLAFTTATFSSALINFIGMKYFVFKK